MLKLIYIQVSKPHFVFEIVNIRSDANIKSLELPAKYLKGLFSNNVSATQASKKPLDSLFPQPIIPGQWNAKHLIIHTSSS